MAGKLMAQVSPGVWEEVLAANTDTGDTAEVFVGPEAPVSSTVLMWVDEDAVSAAAATWLRWSGTQAEYDAIMTKDPNTLYAVTG